MNSPEEEPQDSVVSRPTVMLQGVFVILAGLLAAFVVYGYNNRAKSIDAKIPATQFSLPKFALTDQSGKAFGSSQLNGKIWIASFIFTRCSGPCPRVTGNMARLFHDPSLRGLQFVSISVDPEHDTPSLLTSYGLNYSAKFDRWHFLTGSKKAVYNLIFKGFKVSVQESKDPKVKIGEKFAHTTRLVLIDTKGRIRGYYDANEPEALNKLQTHANLLLQQKQIPRLRQ